ncbi:RIO1 family-domain-containing protein [Lipomyces kononenkoae]|uniref:RIO1 family-domain-containing protein n=1 Tax=Lipomyces kononenkoae TaxID=34357 RepID=A0ACC3TAQ7_LIPKO
MQFQLTNPAIGHTETSLHSLLVPDRVSLPPSHENELDGDDEEDELDSGNDEDIHEFIEDNDAVGGGTGNSKGKTLHDPNEILAKYASRIKVDQLVPDIKNKITDKSDRATIEQVLDPRTCRILAKFINKGELYEINGCISTGKEANVYHARTDSGEHRAVKIYKTSILVFKDRDRYVTGEYRFRHGYSRHNPRKMVKLWAEKEMRNLNRLYQAGIPCPEPIALKMHVLVMGFIGDDEGWASPRLHDAKIDGSKYVELYHPLVAYMIIMYQKCRLVHADLSEYNILYHKEKLVIIDVSQSVEHDHPKSLEFLRMDIKNVNDFFSKHGVICFSERQLFGLVTNTTAENDLVLENLVELVAQTEPVPEDAVDDATFRKMYIPQTLEQVYNIERDVDRIKSGEGHELVYKDLVHLDIKDSTDSESESESDEASIDQDEESSEESGSGRSFEERPTILKGKKFENKDEKKQRKKQVKEQKKEQRAKKMPKHLKKKLVNNLKRH